MRFAGLLPILAILPMMACSAKQIPGTEVDDTPANRRIVEVIDKYRRAVEQKDIDGLLEVVSRDYFSNSGTTSNQDDDYGFEQFVRDKIPFLRDEIKSVSYVIMVTKIGFPKDGIAWANIEYTYNYQYVEQGKDRWKRKTDYDRIEFALEDDVWRITGGL